MRLKISNFIKSRYEFSIDNKKSLLSGNDLHYVEPYLDEIELSAEELQFVTRSQQVEKRRIKIAIFSTIFIIIVLLGLLAWAMIGWNAVKKHEKELIEANSRLEASQKTRDSLSLAITKGAELTKEQMEVLLDEIAFQKDSILEQSILLQAARDSIELLLDQTKEENQQLRSEKKDWLKGQNLFDKNKDRIQSLERQLRQAQQAKAKELMALKSMLYSLQAKYKLENDKDFATAFRFARKAYELDKSNKQAAELLQQIIQRGSDGVGRRFGPKSSSTEEIIRRLKSRYGELTPVQERKFLKPIN